MRKAKQILLHYSLYTMDIPRPKSKQQMPEDAKLVFKGKIFEVYQWEQEGYDGSVHVFEKLKRPDTVVVIPVLEDGRILMTRQEQPGKAPFDALVGGRVDEGEDVLDGAKRELLEETGCVSEEWELFFSEQPVSKIEWSVFYFIARNCKKMAEQSLDGAEKVELEEKTWDEFVEISAKPEFSEHELRLRILEAKLGSANMDKLRKRILG